MNKLPYITNELLAQWYYPMAALVEARVQLHMGCFGCDAPSPSHGVGSNIWQKKAYPTLEEGLN